MNEAIALCTIATLIVGIATFIFVPFQYQFWGIGLAVLFGLVTIALICYNDAKTKGG